MSKEALQSLDASIFIGGFCLGVAGLVMGLGHGLFLPGLVAFGSGAGSALATLLYGEPGTFEL